MAKFFSQDDLVRKSRNHRTRVVDRGFKLGPLSIKFITIGLITILSLIYLAQSNVTATKGYELKELQSEKEELTLENERLEVEANRLKALKNVEKTARKSGMVDVDKVKYP
jgi:cell division protein FtsL